jgi:prophage regulatory protein
MPKTQPAVAGNSQAPTQPSLRRFLPLEEVLAVTGLGRSTLYLMVANGAFPAPVPLTQSADRTGPQGRRVAWWDAEVAAWQDAVIARRDAQLDLARRRACGVCQAPLSAREAGAGVCNQCAPKAPSLPPTTGPRDNSPGGSR